MSAAATIAAYSLAFSDAVRLEHDPEKACPGLDPGWKAVFGKDHAHTKKLDFDPVQSDRIKSSY